MSKYRDTFKDSGAIIGAAFDLASMTEGPVHELAVELHDSLCVALPDGLAHVPASVSGAAPELLMALMAYVQHAESDPDQGRHGSPFHERLQAARAAIAKAEGRS